MENSTPASSKKIPVCSVPDEILRIALHLHIQDNRITDAPIFMVQVKNRVYGLDPDFSDDHTWVSDEEFEEADSETAAAAESNYHDTGEEVFHCEQGAFRRVSYREVWLNHQPFFTETAAEQYLKINGHNLTHYFGVRIYAESSWRNAEWQAIRDFLMSLVNPPEPPSPIESP